MADVLATNGTVLNYAGMLFDTNDKQTPLIQALPREITTSVEFIISSQYATGDPSQPTISEKASLTAPDSAVVTRDQQTNVTQIFMKTTGVSYAKISNTGTLNGVNLGGQQSNVMNELDWQMSIKAKEMRQDLEFTIINGEYNKATSDATANKTRGLISAITTNIEDAAGSEITPYIIGNVMQKIRDSKGVISDAILIVSPIARRQITKNYANEPGFLLPNSRTVGGLTIDQIITDYGTCGLMVHDYVPNGTVIVANLTVLKIKEQPVSGKGNWFWEALAKVGAGDKSQLFGQAGLDYGPEWFHGKIINVSTTMKAPSGTKEVTVMNGNENPVITKAFTAA